MKLEKKMNEEKLRDVQKIENQEMRRNDYRLKRE